MLKRYPDPGGNVAKEWRQNFWPTEGSWAGFEEKLNRVAEGNLFADQELFRFMVNDARTNIENGCNWTAALALLCFTEACGKYYIRTHPKQCDLHARRNFQTFLEQCMLCPDAERLAGELYGDVRCGLVHSFFLLKESRQLEVPEVYVGAGPGPLAENGFQAIDRDGRQVWRFACMPYFRRFVEGLEKLV